jgi:hypothetical protein
MRLSRQQTIHQAIQQPTPARIQDLPLQQLGALAEALHDHRFAGLWLQRPRRSAGLAGRAGSWVWVEAQLEAEATIDRLQLRRGHPAVTPADALLVDGAHLIHQRCGRLAEATGAGCERRLQLPPAGVPATGTTAIIGKR